MQKIALLLLIVFIGNIFIIPQTGHNAKKSETTLSQYTDVREKRFPAEYKPLTPNLIKTKKLGISFELRFPKPYFVSNPLDNRFLIPVIPGASYITIPRKPLIPINVTVVKLPYHARVVNVTIKTEEEVLRINSWISPTPCPIIIGKTTTVPFKVDLSFYSRDFWYDISNKLPKYYIARGLDPNTLSRKTFLLIPIPIITYNPARNLVRYIKRVEINVIYSVAKSIATQDATPKIDLLIITSEKLKTVAIKLAKIKNSSDILTRVKTVEDISTTFDGRDIQEKIRNCIKYFVNNHNITYVLLFGDADQVPARLVYIPDGAYDLNPEIDGVLVESDLYYADLDYTWNENNDSKWGYLPYDKVDGIPDVIVGRIPVSTLEEAENVLNKIINYKPIGFWTKEVTLMGSDISYSYYPEGEFLMNYLAENVLTNFSITKLYETYGNATRLSTYHEFMSGRWYIDFGSHGTPESILVSYTESFTISDVMALRNKILPIVAAMSCTINRFSDTDSIGEILVISPNGGAIAVFGSTRIAWGYIGELVTMGLAGEMNILFTKALVTSRRIGEAWARAITEYAIRHPIYYKLDTYYLDWKTLAEFVLLGDPTLNIKPVPMRYSELREPITVSSGDILYLENLSYKILSNITVSGGTLIIRNSTIHLENSWIIVEGGQVIIENSTIFGNILARSSSSIQIRKSIVTSIKCNQAQAVIEYSVVNVSVKQNANVIINASTIKLDLPITDVVVDWLISEGYVNNVFLSYNTWSLTILDSIITWLRLSFTSCDVNIADKKISEIISTDSELMIKKATVNNLQIINSSVTVDNSTIGLTLCITNSNITLHNLSPGFVENQTLNIVGHITLINSLITEYRFYLQNSTLSISDSKVSLVWGTNSSFYSTNSRIIYADISSIAICNSTALKISGENIIISDSYVSFVKGQNVVITRSTLTQVVAKYGNLQINGSYSEQIELINETALIYNSRVAVLVLYETSFVTIEYTRLAFIDVHDNTQLEVKYSEILYELRIFNAVKVTVSKSFGWIALIITENVTIENIYPGYVSFMSIPSHNLTVYSSLIMWDIIVKFSAKLTLRHSQVDWLFALHNSSIVVQDSNIGLARITHSSQGFIFDSKVDQISVSGNATLILDDSFTETIIVLGNAKVFIGESYITLLVPFGNGYINLWESTVGIEVYIQNDNITLSLSDDYYQSLRIENIMPVSFSSNITNSYIHWYIILENASAYIHDSILSLFACFGPCNLRVERGTFRHFYLINSKASVTGCKVSYLTFISGSNVSIRNSNLAFLYTTENSNISLANSIARLILEFRFGNYEFTLKPGNITYWNSRDFGISPNVLSLILINTKVTGWDLILAGNTVTRVSNSTLVSILTVENSSAEIEHSQIAYLILGDYSQVNVRDSKLGIIPYITYSHVVLNDLKPMVYERLSITSDNGSTFTLDIRNSYITEWMMYAIYSNVITTNSVFYNMTLTSSAVEMHNCVVENYVIAYLSQINATDTLIHSMISIFSDTFIRNTRISNFVIRTLSSAFIENSRVGLNLDLTNVNASVDLPIGKSTFLLASMNMTGITWMLYVVNTTISSWSILVDGPADIAISNTTLKQIAVSGPAYVNIQSCTIGRIVIKALANAFINNSHVAIEIFTYGYDSIADLKTGLITQEIHNLWLLRLEHTQVNKWNITITASSNLTLLNSDFTVMRINGISQVQTYACSSFYVFLREASKMSAKDSSYMLIYLTDNSELVATKSSLGFVFVFVGETRSVSFKTGKIEYLETTEYFGIQPWSAKIVNSEVTLWSVYGIMSHLVLKKQHILGAISYLFSNITLIDTFIENPLYVGYGSIISVYWSLKVIVFLDFSVAENARIEVFRDQEKIAEARCPDGTGTFILPQVIIMDETRIDLGHYLIIAYASGYQSSKTIYLWRPTTTGIYIISYPMLALIICGIIGISLVVIYFIIKRRKSGPTAML